MMLVKQGGPFRLNIAHFYDGHNRTVINKELMKKRRKHLITTAKRHYRNVIQEVRSQLGSPFAMQRTGGGYRILKVRDGEGNGRQVRTAHWPALTEPYRKSDPVSRRMWKKTGKLHGMFVREIRAKQANVKIIRTRTMPASRKGRVRVSHLLEFSDWNNEVVERLIALSFVHGSPKPAQGFKALQLDRNSSELLGYPEAARRVFRGSGNGGRVSAPANRPFVAVLSGRLGREMHRALRKL